MRLKNKKIAVLGLGESGLASALFLQEKGAHVFVSEATEAESIQKRALILQKNGIDYEVGRHSFKRLSRSDLIVISPGISPQTDVFKALHRAQVDMISEIELASCFCPGDIVAVSGTDGKTTVTTLINDILRGCGYNTIQCGNIGNPFVGELARITTDTIVVLEVSSFQLYTIKRFRPKVALLTNIAPDHLNWHYDYADYINAKQKIFQNQTASDYAILNFNDEKTREFLCRIKAKKIFFGQFETEFDPNQDAALQICAVYDCDREKAKEIVGDFKGVEHRLEPVPSSDSITYINDSKSTSLHALEWALARQKKKVILICGGRNKGLDFKTVSGAVRAVTHAVIVFGEAAGEIRDAWSSHSEIITVDTLAEAFDVACRLAQENGTILFSPACTSFDQFDSYVHRGMYFKELVAQRQIVKSATQGPNNNNFQ
jgi:UDP-N-acetylmuramoylalanine--D-glutamate ligase